MALTLIRRLKPSAHLLRGREPQVDVTWWPTPLGSGQRWEDLLPGRCAKCLAPVRMMSHDWWDSPTQRHSVCREYRRHDADVSERKPVTRASRTAERRIICARYGLTQDEYEALPRAQRLGYHQALRVGAMKSARTQRRAAHDAPVVRP